MSAATRRKTEIFRFREKKAKNVEENLQKGDRVMHTRTESDSIGSRQVPASAYYGVTQLIKRLTTADVESTVNDQPEILEVPEKNSQQ